MPFYARNLGILTENQIVLASWSPGLSEGVGEETRHFSIAD